MQHPQDGAGGTLEVGSDPPQAGTFFPHPPNRLHLVGHELQRRSPDLPLLAGQLQPLPRPPLDGLKFLVCHPGSEHYQHLPDEGLGTTFVGLQVAGPLGLRFGQGTNLDAPVPQFADGPHGVFPGPSDAIDGNHHQGVAAGKAAVEMVPSLALLSAGGAGDADVAVDVELGHAGSPELEFLGGGVHPRDPLLEPAAGADVTKNGGHAGSLRLWHTFRNGKVFRKEGCAILPVYGTGGTSLSTLAQVFSNK